LDDILKVANSGWKQLRGTVPVRDSEIFQGELGRASAGIRAARAFLEGQVASLWGHALAGTLQDSGLAIQAPIFEPLAQIIEWRGEIADDPKPWWRTVERCSEWVR
jgi:hypothetical protein